MDVSTVVYLHVYTHLPPISNPSVEACEVWQGSVSPNCFGYHGDCCAIWAAAAQTVPHRKEDWNLCATHQDTWGARRRGEEEWRGGGARREGGKRGWTERERGRVGCRTGGNEKGASLTKKELRRKKVRWRDGDLRSWGSRGGDGISCIHKWT